MKKNLLIIFGSIFTLMLLIVTPLIIDLIKLEKYSKTYGDNFCAHLSKNIEKVQCIMKVHETISSDKYYTSDVVILHLANMSKLTMATFGKDKESLLKIKEIFIQLITYAVNKRIEHSSSFVALPYNYLVTLFFGDNNKFLLDATSQLKCSLKGNSDFLNQKAKEIFDGINCSEIIK